MRPWTLALGLLLACDSTSPASKSTDNKPAASKPTADKAPPPAADAKPAAPTPATPSGNTTINAFLDAGTPTFVVGTLGDDVSDRKVRAQAQMIAGLFPGARVVDDTQVAEAWPEHAVLYGGPHVNAKLKSIAEHLPLALERGSLTIGDQTQHGDATFFMGVVPAQAAADGHPGWPEFLLYAGTGAPGVGEINGVATHGPEPFLVADAFGRLYTGTWQGPPWQAALGKPERRIEWRTTKNTITSGKAGPGTLRVHFPKMVPAADNEDDVVAAVWRGVNRASRGISLSATVDVDVFVHPDRGSKKSLTGREGDGHAIAEARTLHVIAGDPAEGGVFESLVAHEATHVLTYATLGATPSPLLGEGVAVWVSGQYGGRSLEDWRKEVDFAQDPRAWIGAGFRRAPEPVTYPIAGLLVGAAVETVGWEAFAEHILPASEQTWDAALGAAGTDHEALRKAMRKGS